MATPLANFLFFVICSLVVASYVEAMVEGNSMLQSSIAVKVGVASSRRGLADNTTTVNSTQTLLEDADVLLLFKAAITRDPYNATKYWKPIGKRQRLNPCRPWVGITCTKRRVTSINLYNQSLQGSVSAVLGRLSQLRTLNLSSNQFSGDIPSALSSASLLESLDVGSNNLTGALPSSLGDIKNLTSLVVSDNDFTGNIPTSLGTLQNLRNLNMSRNNFTGTIPTGLVKAVALEVLDLSTNNVSGGLPSDIGNLTNLRVLDVSTNMIQGALPATLGNCTSLVSLDLSSNPLYGSIPSTLGQLRRLETLRFASSNITGTIPQELTGCTNLKDIDLSNNSLQGDVPFQNLQNLTVLHLQNNFLQGNFVTNIATFPNLEDLDLTNNRFNGSLPHGVGGIPLKKNFLLARNSLTGSIPDEVGELSLVQRVDLSSNKLSGSVPEAINKCVSLIELDISSNVLTGGFSMSLGTLVDLMQLNISHNFLNGSLPTLSQFTNLKAFDASFNSFSGGVPTTFVNFTSLNFLNVSSNHLSGEVPYFKSHDHVTAQSFLNNSHLCGKALDITCGSNKLAASTIIYIAVGCFVGIIVLIFLLIYCVKCYNGRNGKGSKHSAQVSVELQLKLTPEEILAATNSFNEANYIGVGKMSTVYRGVLPDDTIVAVKRLAIDTTEGQEDAEKVLDAELEVLGHIRHRSLIKVLGYCSSPEIKALVLEYMPNGCLDSLLYPPQEDEVHQAFDWPIRFKIAIEVAEGLKYLHHESRYPIVHGDVKPSNILLNAKMEAKIGDFGVSRILAEQGFGPTSPSTIAHGYTPPEVAASGTPTMKGDVYSFGIILLEMISGRSPFTLEPGQTLPQWIRATVANSKALQNVLDPILMPDINFHQQKMAMVLGVALLCTRNNPQERPLMDDVYKMLTHIRTKTVNSSRRKGLRLSSKRNSSAQRRSASGKVDIQSTSEQPLPHTPSLSDWTPPDDA